MQRHLAETLRKKPIAILIVKQQIWLVFILGQVKSLV